MKYDKRGGGGCSKCGTQGKMFLIVGGHWGVSNEAPEFCELCKDKVIQEIDTGKTSLKDVQR